jgi:putative acyl-CoA dehydrogenase
MATHDVLNQPPPLRGYNLFAADRALTEGLEREGGGWAADRVHEIGDIAGAEAIEWGVQANANPPVLRTHDRYGNRIDEVEFHPAWHRLMELSVGHGCTRCPGASRGPARTWRARRCSLVSPGRSRPRLPDLDDLLGRSGPALQPELAREWEPRLHLARTTTALRSRRRRSRRALRHGHDRKAGRLGRSRQHPRGRSRSAPRAGW